jgi:hypothetical protein
MLKKEKDKYGIKKSSKEEEQHQQKEMQIEVS